MTISYNTTRFFALWLAFRNVQKSNRRFALAMDRNYYDSDVRDNVFATQFIRNNATPLHLSTRTHEFVLEKTRAST